MRELELDHYADPPEAALPGSYPAPAPLYRPSWSVRASEAKLRTVDGGTNDEGTKRRPYSAASPSLDAALAMQLRPGLGVGADAAWLVRFVMAIFGWCTVLVSGRGEE